MEMFYPDITNEEILPFVAMWKDLEGNVLSEISQTEKTNTVKSYLHLE